MTKNIFTQPETVEPVEVPETVIEAVPQPEVVVEPTKEEPAVEAPCVVEASPDLYREAFLKLVALLDGTHRRKCDRIGAMWGRYDNFKIKYESIWPKGTDAANTPNRT